MELAQANTEIGSMFSLAMGERLKDFEILNVASATHIRQTEGDNEDG
jgi:hypothetical protein